MGVRGDIARVLVVGAGDGVAESLRAGGVEDVEVTTGSELETELASSPPACVVVGPAVDDPVAPIETVQVAAPSVPVVVVTDGDQAAKSALGAGATDVARPSDPPELLASRVTGAIGARRDEGSVLGALHRTTRQLVDAPDREAVADLAAEAVHEVLDRPASGLLLYDPAVDGLVPRHWSDRARELLDDDWVYTDEHPAVWEAYLAGEPAYVPDCQQLDASTYPVEGVDARSSMLHPLGDHGLFLVTSPDPDDFDAADRQFISLLGAAVERALDRLAREAALTDLHDVATELGTADTREAVYDATVEAAANLLEFDDCVFRVERDGVLEVVAASSEHIAEATVPMSPDTGLAGAGYRDGRSFVVDDAHDHPLAVPVSDYRSALSVPVGDYGVFQAGHERVGHFDETDRELAEILTSHAAAALSRLDSERRQREQRQNFEHLFDLTPAPVVHARFDSEEPRVRTVNEAFESTFGVDATAVVDAPLNDIVAPGENRRSAERIAEQVRAGEAVEREVVRQTVDGERRFILRVEPLRSGGEMDAIGVYVDVTERSEREQLLAALHEVATDIEACETKLAVSERTVEAAQDLLAFDYCGVSLAEDGVLVPTVANENMPPDWVAPRSPESGLIGTVYDTGDPRVVDDVDADPDADPRGPFGSALVVPLGDHGVFSAVDHDRAAFDETDLELAELLADHARAAMSNISWAADIAAERERFAGLLDLVDVPVVHCTDAIHGPVVRSVNQAFEETFGYDADALTGRSLHDFIVSEAQREEAESIHELARDDEPVERTVTRRTADGDREFHLRLLPLEDTSETVGVYDPVRPDERDDTGTAGETANAGE